VHELVRDEGRWVGASIVDADNMVVVSSHSGSWKVACGCTWRHLGRIWLLGLVGFFVTRGAVFNSENYVDWKL